ncbi:MAG TPA: FAD-dependent oxidoreductase [Myxococcales bacterium]|nr:FAD-dependent oxidoreductase [Myxococcales bacterium]
MNLRRSNIDRLESQAVDVLIIGAGINGAVSAAVLAAKGVQVGLIDQGDFSGGTSQESSNLAWGGIKYLENFEFQLVRKLCRSRNRLMRAYPLSTFSFRWTRWVMGFCWSCLFSSIQRTSYWLGDFTFPI